MKFFASVIVALSLVVSCKTEVLIGEHTNATYYTKQNTDIHGLLYSALSNGESDIRIATGTYYMSKTIRLMSNVYIHGTKNDNSAIVNGELLTLLKVNSTQLLGLALFVTLNATNVTVSDLVIDGYNMYINKSGEVNGVAFVDSSNVLLSKLNITNFRNGVFLNKTMMITIDNCAIFRNDYDGALVRRSYGVIVSNAYTRLNGRHGFNIASNSSNVTITNSDIRRNKDTASCGVTMDKGNNFEIINNNLTLTNQSGVCMRDVSNVIIANNVIISVNDRSCIKIHRVTNAQFVNNKCNAIVNVNPTLSPPPKSPKIEVGKSPMPSPPPKKKSAAVRQTTMSYGAFLTMLIVITLL
jgi:hypothetical protein